MVPPLRSSDAGLSIRVFLTMVFLLRQSLCLFSYHLFIIFTHTPVCPPPPIRRWNVSAGTWRPIALSHKHQTSASSSQNPPHQTSEVTAPFSDFQHVFHALLCKTRPSTKPPKRSASAPLPRDFTLHRFPFILFYCGCSKPTSSVQIWPHICASPWRIPSELDSSENKRTCTFCQFEVLSSLFTQLKRLN